MNKTKVNTFSVYLITDDLSDLDELVVEECRNSKIKIGAGCLYYKIKDKDYYPSWVRNFFGESKLGKNADLFKTKSVAAIFLTKVDVEGKLKTFAVAFGAGRYILKQDYIQKEFGLNTSQRAIDPSRVISMCTLTYDSNIKSKTVNSITEIAQNDFFLNANTDILTSVKGRVRDNISADLLLNRTIGGKDSVSMSAKVDVNNLHLFLKQLYDQYMSKNDNGVKYISNIRHLTETSDIQKVENLLDGFLQSKRQNGRVALNLPLEYIKDGITVKGYIIGDNEYKELSETILDVYNTITLLKETQVTIEFDDESNNSLKLKLFSCVYAELEEDNYCFIISDGNIYQVTKSYLEKVNQFYSSIDIAKIPELKRWHGEPEGKFNACCDSKTILVMDKVLIHPEGSGKFEFCDLLTYSKQIIHAKIYDGASQPLGHLFNQGLVSVMGITDEDIRSEIQIQIDKQRRGCGKSMDFSIGDPFKASDYTIVFLILCRNGDAIVEQRPQIPFLAKSIFRENVTKIQSMGFKVEILGIGIENRE